MDSHVGEKPEYGNWVSTRIIYLPFAVGLVFLGLCVLFLFSAVPAALFLIVAGYFAYARRQFSADGGNVQDRIWELVLAHLDWDRQGRALDIGCGNGALTIKLAKKNSKAQVTGIDYWGERWEYSKDVCERNAKIENVGDRTTFQKASASALPFDDGFFNAAVSNLAFHEVSDTKNKREVVREVLRVVEKGGKFAFQDLFLDKRLYGDMDSLLAEVKGWGIAEVEFVATRDADFIPGPLKLPFMVGTMGIIKGKK